MAVAAGAGGGKDSARSESSERNRRGDLCARDKIQASKEFRCSHVYEHRNQFSRRQDGGDGGRRAFSYSSGPGSVRERARQGPVNLRKVIRPCKKRLRAYESELGGKEAI